MENFVFIKLSLKDKNYITIGKLFEELAIEIKDYIKNHLEIEENSISCNNNSEYQDILKWFKPIFLPEVYGTLGDKNVVLMLDEFDNLDDINQDKANNFYKYFNQIVVRNNKLCLLPVIGKAVEELSKHFQNSFRQVTLEKIALLKTSDVKKLIIDPTAKLKYQDAAIEAILKLSANHP
ncbi:hypothetical protein [Okeania sp.]|uniref:hypothetical protein n=1 Tax=Okeania sp. TaxID=3100323 RepID=UPI002B4B5C5A|nr:hypothetical protein [Okeania sp.]MEB3339272.1 hypothetical protein [Okeania sp.]